MKHIHSILTIALLWAVYPLYVQAQYDRLPLKNDICEKIVIGDFTCKNCTSADEGLAEKYRDQISMELTYYRYCKVIERDRLAEILRRSENEAAISSLDQLSPAERTELTSIIEAKRILFGSIEFQINRSLLVTIDITNLESTRSELKYQFEIPEDSVQIFVNRKGYIERNIQEMLMGKDAGAEPPKPVTPEETTVQPPADDNPPVVTGQDAPPAPAEPETPFTIQGAIKDKWLSLGGKNGPLGNVVTDEKTAANGTTRFNDFEKGTIYWTPGNKAYVITDEIYQKWTALKRETGPMGLPLTDVMRAFDATGKFAHFENGSIYWSPNTGAHEVRGVIRDLWKKLDWAKGVLGYPLTDQTATPLRQGRFNHFQHGSIYASDSTGAYAVLDPIREKWKTLGWAMGILGFPIAEEAKTRDGTGRYSLFEKGVIYWSPRTVACEVHGAILDKWTALGRETGRLGYPISDEKPSRKCAGCRESNFQHGTIYWSEAQGAWVE